MFGNELTTMIDDGAGLVVGTVGVDGEPRAARAWSARVLDAGTRRMRIVVGADDPVTVANLVPDAVVALTGADVRTFRSVQLKGRVVTVAEVDATDVAVTRVQSNRFLEVIHATDGNPLDALRRMLPLDVVAIEVVIDEVFDQTPGPDAGNPLVAS